MSRNENVPFGAVERNPSIWSAAGERKQGKREDTGYEIAVSKKFGRDPFNQNSDRSDREKRTTSKGGPVFSKLFRLDRTDPLSFGPKFPEILVEWIAPFVFAVSTAVSTALRGDRDLPVF